MKPFIEPGTDPALHSTRRRTAETTRRPPQPSPRSLAIPSTRLLRRTRSGLAKHRCRTRPAMVTVNEADKRELLFTSGHPKRRCASAQLSSSHLFTAPAASGRYRCPGGLWCTKSSQRSFRCEARGTRVCGSPCCVSSAYLSILTLVCL